MHKISLWNFEKDAILNINFGKTDVNIVQFIQKGGEGKKCWLISCLIFQTRGVYYCG